MSLHNYIDTLSEHGTHRLVATLNGDQIQIKRLCKALGKRIESYVGMHQHRVAWFKTSSGVVLMASGSRVITDVVDTFLQTYAGGYQEHQVLYVGTGSKVFKRVVNESLADYAKCGRSFGASR